MLDDGPGFAPDMLTNFGHPYHSTKGKLERIAIARAAHRFDVGVETAMFGLEQGEQLDQIVIVHRLSL